MPLTPPAHMDDSRDLPNLIHGVPGIEWHRDAQAEPPRKRPPVMPADDSESFALYLWIIFGVALALRVLVVFSGPFNDIHNAYTPQTALHLRLAENLRDHHAFGLTQQPEHSIAARLDAMRAQRGELPTIAGTDLHPEAYASPGYPALLAAAGVVTANPRWWLIGQCVIGALCVPVVYRLGRGVVGRKVPAVLAAAFVAVHPAFIIAPAALAADAVVVLLVLLGLWAVAHAEGRSFRGVAGGGLALGSAALFSPALAWLAPLAAAWIVFTERRLRSIALAIALILAAALPIGAWTYRNAQQGVGSILSAQPVVDRLFGTLAATLNPPAGPYDRNTTDTLFTGLRGELVKHRHKDATVFEVADMYSRAKLAEDRAVQLGTLRRSALTLGLGHSLDQAYARLGIDYAPSGYAARRLGQLSLLPGQRPDAATGHIINAWVGLNAATLVAALVGAGLMLWRRRIAGFLLLLMAASLLVVMSTAGPTEPLRLLLLAIQALMTSAILAPGPIKEKKSRGVKLHRLDDESDAPTGSTFVTALSTSRPI